MIQDDFAFADSGGRGEYKRLKKARRLSQDKKVVDVANSVFDCSFEGKELCFVCA